MIAGGETQHPYSRVQRVNTLTLCNRLTEAFFDYAYKDEQ